MSKISVALCTFNGEKYIREQLASIFNQSLQPSEIVICDDQSTDQTINIVKEIAKDATVPIRFYINEERLGVTRNFAKAISLCKHEYIACSDQDDVWKNERMEIQFKFFNDVRNKNINVVFTDLELVDEQLNPINKTMWEWLLFTGKRRKIWRRGKHLKVMMENGNVVTGATLMIKKDFGEKVLLYLEKSFKLKIFDEIIALLAIRENSLGIIEMPLVFYRQHNNQVLGTSNFTGDKKRTLYTAVEGLQTKKISTERLLHIIEHNTCKKEELISLGFEEEKLCYYNHLIKHIKCRLQLPTNYFIRSITILNEFLLGRYLRYSKSLIMTPIKDLLNR